MTPRPPEGDEPPLPRALRRVTLVALVLSGMLGFGAAQGMTMLFDPPAPSDLDFSSLSPMPGLEQRPELYREAVRALALAQLSAWQSMRDSRAVILFALWAVSALMFVSALRMIRPRGSPRFAVRGMLGTMTMIAAVLRTIDGAQSAAVARRAGSAFDKVLARSAEIPGGWPDGLWANGYAGISMLVSLVVGGGLLMLSRYYRSEKVKGLTRDLDASASSK